MVSMAAESPAPTASGGPRGPLLMSMTEIAELAQVKRPVVTTWRRRYPDFPKPADGDATSPLFDSRQVAEWLIGTGRDPAGRIEADLRLHALAGLGTGLPPSDLLALLTALICLRDQDGEPGRRRARRPARRPAAPRGSPGSSRLVPVLRDRSAARRGQPPR